MHTRSGRTGQRCTPAIPSGEAEGVWEYEVTDFREVAQPHSAPKCVLGSTVRHSLQLGQTFPTSLQGPRPLTHHSWLAAEQEPAAMEAKHTPQMEPAELRGSGALLRSFCTIIRQNTQSQAQGGGHCRGNLTWSCHHLAQVSSELTKLQSLAPAGGSAQGVWTRATGAPPHAMGEGNKSPNSCQFLCQLDVLHV